MNTQQTEINWQEIYTNLETRLDNAISEIGITSQEVFTYMTRMTVFEGSMQAFAFAIFFICSLVGAIKFFIAARNYERKSYCIDDGKLHRYMGALVLTVASVHFSLGIYYGVKKVIFPEYFVVKEVIQTLK